MINPSETQPPRLSAAGGINAAETQPPGGAAVGAASIVLNTGESIADSYVVHSLMTKQGRQANVYLAKKWGKSYVIKVYHSGWRPSDRLQSFLTSVRHPNIAHVVESGTHGGCYYEIYEYYAEGTLEEAPAMSPMHIQNVIVPSINEGLNELHRNGIVHCDIKPSNLYLADGGERVVIGDCGISGYTNANGKLVDAVRGTPEYAPRVRALLWSAAMSPAYDYGSFGLVLCRAVLGKSLFAGMSVEEISRAWEGGLELPGSITGRLSVLIRGLLNEDESQRWGYVQVKRWCEGEYMRPVQRSLYSRPRKEQQVKPLIFGRFEGQTLAVSSLHQLAKAAREHWAQATNIVKRRELYEFVRQFDKEMAEKIKPLMMLQDADAAAFKLLMYLQDDPMQISYCGRSYGSLEEYVRALASGKDEIASRFLTSGLLVFYLRENDYESATVDKLEMLIRRTSGSDMAAITTICFALQGKKSIDVYGESVETLDDLIPVIRRCSIAEIDALLGEDHFIAWLNRLGYEKETRRMKELFAK